MKTPSVPAGPDPTALAAAQAGANKQTAITQQEVNMVGQNTPQGKRSYAQTGTWEDGTPKFELTDAYSPEQQNLYDLGNKTQQNIGQIGVDQSARIGELLGTPYNPTTGADSKIAQIQKGFLDPQWDRAAEQNKAQLVASGIRPGSEAYTRNQRDFSDERQKGYDRSYLDAYQTANQQALTERNQPINEISALLSNSQVSQPSYANTPTAGVAPTDVIGANQLSLQQANMNAQLKNQSNMGLMSGAFGIGKAGLGAFGGWG